MILRIFLRKIETKQAIGAEVATSQLVLRRFPATSQAGRGGILQIAWQFC